MPTKQEVEDYLKETQSNSVLSASLHFRVEPSDIWKALDQLQPIEKEIASCSNSKQDSLLCANCRRGREQSGSKFKIKQVSIGDDYECDGYVNKDTKSLFEK